MKNKLNTFSVAFVLITLAISIQSCKQCVKCTKLAPGWPIDYKVCEDGSVESCNNPMMSNQCSPYQHNWGVTQEEVIAHLESNGFNCQ